ncbi:MAG: DUF4252 domain-containing protein [Bacteroidales bacterium]|jgi:hypothetical protein
MKKFSILLCVLLVPVFLMAQPASVRRLLRSCDTGKEVTRIHLPPVLFRMASWFVDQDEKQILRNIHSMYLVVSEDKEFSLASDFPTRVAEQLQGKNFEEMMVVSNNGEKVTILLREQSRNRKEMVIAVDGDEDVVLYLQGKLDWKEILEKEHIDLGSINFFD